MRPIDAYALNNALVSWYNDTEGETEKSILRRVMQMVVHVPTITPPNEALTMEQLRQMKGQPVWTVTTGIKESGRWELVCDVDYEDVLEMASCVDGFYDIEVGTYGSTWAAYRRPPEGEADGK